jgi:3-oxoacyl-[acyl-carrier-protein] synthase-3
MSGPNGADPRRAPGRGRAAIRDIAVALPQATVANEQLLAELPAAKAALLARRAGVERRHVAAPGQTALDLGEEACRELFAAHPDLFERIDILVFCTQTPDHPLPPNSCALHGRLRLPDRVMAFDIPHACSAFVYALQLVDALFQAGAGREALIVTADTYSSLISADDRATRVLFGDGAAATWLSMSSEPTRGFVDFRCGTDGTGFGAFVVAAGGARMPITDEVLATRLVDQSGNARTPAQIAMNGLEILTFVGARMPDSIKGLLDRNELQLDDVDLLVFHQASAVVLDTLTMRLGADPGRVVRSLELTGNTVSASIPMTLRKAMDDHRLAPGDVVLLCGFGAGLSWGSALLRW